MQKTTSNSSVSTLDTELQSDDSCRVIGKRGRQRGQLSNPQDVLFIHRPQPSLLVSDTINQNIQLFSINSGQATGLLSSASNTKSVSVRRPIGLSTSIDQSSVYLVADYDQHFISTWSLDDNSNGKFIKKFGQQSLIGPKGLCQSSQSNRVVVADNKANCICIFDAKGAFVHRFGTRGAEAHELAGPHYVRFAEHNDDRTILVTDFYNNCVKVFDIERHGQLVTSFGSIGTKNGLFQAPTGLAVDYERGYVFVADWGNNRIQVFDRQGTFVRLINLSKSDMLYGPQGLDYEPLSQTLAVANSGRHCALLLHIDWLASPFIA